MLEYAIKNILRRKSRSLLTVSGVAIMMTLVIVITGIVSYQVRTMNAHAAAGSGKINIQPLLAGSGYPAEGIDFRQEEADGVLSRTHAFIQPALSTKILFFPLEAPLYPNQPPELILAGIEPGKEEAFTGSVANNTLPTAGVEFFRDSSEAYPVILGMHAAEVLEEKLGRPMRPGERVNLLGTEYTVIGILNRSADLVVNNAVIVPLERAQNLLDKSGFVSSVILAAQSISMDRDIQGVIRESFPRLTVVSNDTIRRNAAAGIQLFEALVQAISAVVLLCAALLLTTVMLITVKERTKEIGVLRALGASKANVILSIGWEILLLSLAGSLVGGVISGFVLAFALEQNLFDPLHILSYLPLAVVLTLIAGGLPAVQISRIQPMDALRYE